MKHRFDPAGVFNPGKIVNAPRMNDRSLLRYHRKYQSQQLVSQLAWEDWGDQHTGLQGAVEMCNNNGACRKLNGGVMCPSYRVTGDEKDVTRGRANTLRLALSGQLGKDAITSSAMQDTMKLCVSCKACKRECPTGVDMAKMKLEVLSARYAASGLSLQDRLVSQLPAYAPYAARLAPVVNLRNRWPWLARGLEKVTGFSANRRLPAFTGNWFRETQAQGDGRPVVLLADTFNTWFEPWNLRAAVDVLVAFGYQVHIAGAHRGKRLCCGRTYLSVGNLDKARQVAAEMCDSLYDYVKEGVPVIGLEPSCLLTLRDEHLSLLTGDKPKQVAKQAFLFEEFIAHQVNNKTAVLPSLNPSGKTIKLHGHCHQKAFDLMDSVQQTLSLVPDTKVEPISSSCCGMAGAFGYQKDTEAISRKMAALDLVPAIESAADDALIVAAGTSCRHQIGDCTNRHAMHSAVFLKEALVTSPAQ